MHTFGACGAAIIPFISTVCAQWPGYGGPAGPPDQATLGPPAYTVPAGFPTSIFSSYYIAPAPTQEPQPAVYDPIYKFTYPLNLTDQDTIPEEDPDPVVYPVPIAQINNASAVIAKAVSDIQAVISGPGSNCTKCQRALVIGQNAGKLAPSSIPDAMVALCKATKFRSNASCEENYEATNFGAVWTQIIVLGDMAGLDGQYVCSSLSSTFCPKPYVLPSNTAGLWKPKPAHAVAPSASGKKVKVLHISDYHLDPRYAEGSEANCSSGICCRTNAHNTQSPIDPLSPAPLYGAYKCDTPYYLATGVLEAVGPLTNTLSPTNPECKESLAWSIYTGDLVSHDSQNQLSRAYTTYTETAAFHMMKTYIQNSPIYAALGNHDSNPEAIDAPHSLPGPLGEQQSWNYDHVAGLWQNDGWITPEAAASARRHYAGYSIHHPQYPKLKIVTLNSDFWYRNNFLNFINTTNPDNSGMFSFLISELQAAEDANERVWIVQHVLTGWDGSNPNPNPIDLYYQIIDRYSPHVIANIFFGHTHEDQVMIYYSQNGTVRDAAHAQAVGWIGPSVVPLTNLNSGFRMYEVDTGSFEIMDAYTWYADVNSFPAIDATKSGPTYKFEYSTREAYPIGWPEHAPLNATYWHRVTEAMEKNHTLVSVFNTYQGKMSVKSPNCTSDACAQAKVCYMRSGSVGLGRQCPQGYADVNQLRGESCADVGVLDLRACRARIQGRISEEESADEVVEGGARANVEKDSKEDQLHDNGNEYRVDQQCISQILAA